MLQIAERLGRHHFQVGQAREALCWEPLVDMHQRDEGLIIWVALPGVAPNRFDVNLEASALVLRGERALSVDFSVGDIFQLEIPYGRFERRVPLPQGEYRMDDRQLEHGCLRLRLVRVS